ncbi:hypothetical protein HDU79_005434 [Rhizoclosmatium sp. JEL0117]|nr:hypothetical protein HDU79_005434 [Rhizoclosmatium sp. JEL0117]
MASSTDTIFMVAIDAESMKGRQFSVSTTIPKPFQTTYFPSYEVKVGAYRNLDIEERPSLMYTIVLGGQHLLASFSACWLLPILMGFDPNTTLFFAGFGTLLFYAITGGRVPSFLGASAAFIAPVLSATQFNGPFGSTNPNIAIAQGGIFVTGLVYAVIGLLIHFFGTKYIKILMPPLVSGAVVMAIGLNLAGIGINNAASGQDGPWQACLAIICIGAFAAFGPGFTKQVPILLGLILSYAIAAIAGKATGRDLDWSVLDRAEWFAAPKFTAPVFDGNAIATILPAVIALLAENMGHVSSIGAIANRNLDGYLGRAFLGDAVATMVSALGGGAGVTTYAENIGTMAVTRVYSTSIFLVAAVFAILLSFIHKFGGVLRTIPNGIWGGVEIVLFGLIAITGARIWASNRVDLTDTRNLFIAAVPVILGSGMPSLPGGTLTLGSVKLDGIGMSAISALVLNFFIWVIPEALGMSQKE